MSLQKYVAKLKARHLEIEEEIIYSSNPSVACADWCDNGYYGYDCDQRAGKTDDSGEG